jgi:hypothetical protein
VQALSGKMSQEHPLHLFVGTKLRIPFHFLPSQFMALMAVSYQRSGGPDSLSRQGRTARRCRHDALKPYPPNCDVQGRDPQCPVHVDSSRPKCANTVELHN